MPHYDYQCSQCGHEFEVYQSITEDPLKECPKCQGSVNRLMSSGAGLIFKGSGFYITDYKNKSNNASTNAKDDSKKTDDKTGTAESNSKTDKKPSSTDKKK